MNNFNKLQTAFNVVKTGKEFYDENRDTINSMSRVAISAAMNIRENGVKSTAHEAIRSWDTPENRERLLHATLEMGSAALRGAALETGMIDEKGRLDRDGVLQAAAGLKEGTTQKRAVIGARQAGLREGRAQVNSLGNELV